MAEAWERANDGGPPTAARVSEEVERITRPAFVMHNDGVVLNVANLV